MKTNLKYTSTTYTIKANTVKCVLESVINIENIPCYEFLVNDKIFIKSILSNFSSNKNTIDEFHIKIVDNNIIIKTLGIAQCHPNDKFDEELGKHIANTRAQHKAQYKAFKIYKLATKRVTYKLNKLYMLKNNCQAQYNKSKSHINELINESYLINNQNNHTNNNLKIIDEIEKLIKEHPYLRFTQILSILELDKDNFYEEPNKTLIKIKNNKHFNKK